MYQSIQNVFRIVSRTGNLRHVLSVALVFGYATLLNLVNFTPALAQNAAAKAAREPIAIELQAFKVLRDEKGNEQFQAAQKMKPGDVLEYRAVYTNVSKQEVKNLQANLPIPVTTEVLLDSLFPKAAKASADGRNYSSVPLMQAVKLPNGAVQNRPLPLALYRSLSWPIGTVAPGGKVTVRARVRLNSTFAPR